MSKNCFSGKRFIRICLYGIGCCTFFFLLDEATNEPRNMIRRAVEREMPAIDDVHFGLRHVVAIGFRLRRSKESSYLPQITNRRGCFSRIQDCLASEATGALLSSRSMILATRRPRVSCPHLRLLASAASLQPVYIVRTTRNCALPLIMRAYASAAFSSGYVSIMARTPVSSAKRSVSSSSAGVPEAHP
jgi:hypothetical protein